MCLSPVSFPAAPPYSWKVQCLCFSVWSAKTLSFLLSKFNIWDSLPTGISVMGKNQVKWLPDSLVLLQDLLTALGNAAFKSCWILVYYEMEFLAERLMYLRLCRVVLQRQFILVQTHFLFFLFLLLAPLPTLSIPSSSPLCKFFPACKKMECPFYHPKVRYISYLPSVLERDLKHATLQQEMLIGFNTFFFYCSHFDFAL